MAVTGTRPETIEATIRTGLVNQTVSVGTSGSEIAFTLTIAEDDENPSTGAESTADGGFVVRCEGDNANTAQAIPQTSGTSLQYQVMSSFLITVAYQVSGARGEAIATAKTAVRSRIVDLVLAALQPLSGANVNVRDWSTALARRANRQGYYLQDLRFRVAYYWG